MVLERKDIRPFATDASLQSLDRDRSAAETEMDILRSRQFAGRVVDRLKLIDDSSFNPYVQSAEETGKTTSGIFSFLLKLLEKPSPASSYFTKTIGYPEASDPAPATPDRQIQRDRAITTLLTQYAVKRTGESFAVEITRIKPEPPTCSKNCQYNCQSLRRILTRI